MEQCKKWYVLILKGCALMYQVWIYDNNLEKSIKLGPITEPRHVENEITSGFHNDMGVPCKGCPVICHGLYSRLQHHLNGEVGNVISYQDIGKGIHLEVRFEKRGLQSEWVHQDNLHIAYELPSIDGRVLECKDFFLLWQGRPSV